MLIHHTHTNERFLMTEDQVVSGTDLVSLFHPILTEGSHAFPWFDVADDEDDECSELRIAVEHDHDEHGKCRGAIAFITRGGAAIAMFGVALTQSNGAAQRVWKMVSDVYDQLKTTKLGRERNWALDIRMPLETPWASSFPIFDEMPDECWRNDIVRGWAWAFQEMAESGAFDLGRVGCEG